MTTIPSARRAAMFVGGITVAGAFALATAPAPSARAASGSGRAIQIQKINVAQGSGVPANSVVEITMSQAVDPSTVTPATVQVRGQNATLTGYTKQVVGSFQVVGNVVRFFPRLPTHLRDAAGKFFPQGSPLDDAAANTGFKPICSAIFAAAMNAKPGTITSSPAFNPKPRYARCIAVVPLETARTCFCPRLLRKESSSLSR